MRCGWPVLRPLVVMSILPPRSSASRIGWSSCAVLMIIPRVVASALVAARSQPKLPAQRDALWHRRSAMGFIDVSELSYSIGGHQLFHDVSFRVGEGSKVALVGANGTGKTTLLRLIAGDIKPESGTISNGGGIGIMRQFIGSAGGTTTVRDFLLSLAPAPIQVAGAALHAAERALAGQPDNAEVAITYAQAVADWASAGGYDAEVTWNV